MKLKLEVRFCYFTPNSILLKYSNVIYKLNPLFFKASFVKPCRRSDPQINTCVRNTINSLKDRIPHGIPELFIPALEPLVVPEIKMDQDSGAIYLHSTYKNVNVHGLSNYTLTDMLVDTTRPKIVMTMTFPNVTMNAKYVMKGKIMMMPLMGNGDCQANFSKF